MKQDACREVKEKAPLVDVDELTDQVLFDIIDDELRERADSVWMLGSFVNPGREIDTKGGRSDIDVFIQLPDWDFPQAGTGMAMFASDSRSDIPAIYDRITTRNSWSPIEGPESVVWECSVDEAWERMPADVQRSLVESTKNGFFANEEDRQAGKPRHYDLLVGNQAQLEFNRTLERRNGAKLIDTRIWPPSIVTDQ